MRALAERLSSDQVLGWRLRRHHLGDRAPRKRMLDVVSSICGLHAQVMSSAELTLWARVDGLRPDDVSKALWDERRLVKTWGMRGTLHLLPADELPMWLAGFATYDHYLKGAWFKAFGMSREELERLIDAVGEALGGKPLTRVELAEAVTRATGDASLGEKLSESWGAYLKPAAFRGRLCFAPDRGRNVCFTRRDRFVSGKLGRVEPDAALDEVTRRWLQAYGPGTRESLARWWGLQSPARAGKMLDALDDEGGGGRRRGQEAAHARRGRRPGRSDPRRSARRCSSRASTSGSWARRAARPRYSTRRRRRGSTARRAGSRRHCW